MKKYQLFTRKDGQQPVGNKFAIYDTLAEADVSTQIGVYLKVIADLKGLL